MLSAPIGRALAGIAEIGLEPASPATPDGVPGLSPVRKNSRSRGDVQAQCCFVPSAPIGAALAEIARMSACRRSRDLWMGAHR